MEIRLQTRTLTSVITVICFYLFKAYLYMGFGRDDHFIPFPSHGNVREKIWQGEYIEETFNTLHHHHGN